ALTAETDGLRWNTESGRRLGPTNAFVPIEHDRIDRSVPEFFEESSARYPDCIAIKAKVGSLTYQGLNHEDNCVARAILAEPWGGVQPVALLLEKVADKKPGIEQGVAGEALCSNRSRADSFDWRAFEPAMLKGGWNAPLATELVTHAPR